MRVVWLRGRRWWVAGWAGSAGCPEPLSNGQDQMCGIEGRPPDQRVFGTPSGFNVPKRPSQTRVTVRVPGTYVAEVGPTGVASKANEERGSQAPGRVRVQFRHAEGAVREAVEGHVEGRGAWL